MCDVEEELHSSNRGDEQVALSSQVGSVKCQKCSVTSAFPRSGHPLGLWDNVLDMVQDSGQHFIAVYCIPAVERGGVVAEHAFLIEIS